MRIRVIDFETTGEPPEADVIEAAYVDVVVEDVPTGVEHGGMREYCQEARVEAPGWTTLVRPTRPISVEAKAVHHIDEMEVTAPNGIPWSSARATLQGIGTVDGPPDVYCAHNAAFEKQLFNPKGSRWICTYKAALRLWPDAPRHSNSVLRYFLEGCDPGEAGMPPHRALPDCRVTALILIRALQEASVEQLVEWEGQPRWQPVIGFGKHRGTKWADAPRDYIAWVLRSDFDEDTKWNARQALK